MKKVSKKQKALREKVGDKVYSPAEAIALARETAQVKFDASIEVHIRLGTDSKKPEQQVRGTVVLPHGTGKKLRIAAFVGTDKADAVKKAGASLVGGEELVEEIRKTEKCDFDVAIATPDMMRFLGKVGKVLGTKGLMPNPKTETISPDPVKLVTSLLTGKIAFRADESGNIHQMIGKTSFDTAKLEQNFDTLVAAVKRSRPDGVKGEFLKRVVICSTMGPAIPVSL